MIIHLYSFLKFIFSSNFRDIINIFSRLDYQKKYLAAVHYVYCRRTLTKLTKECSSRCSSMYFNNRWYTTQPDKHGRVVLVPCKKWRFCTILYNGQVTFYKVPETHVHVQLVTLYCENEKVVKTGPLLIRFVCGTPHVCCVSIWLLLSLIYKHIFSYY